MINRVLSRGETTNYIDVHYRTTYVTFKNLEPKTKLRLLALGYCPAVRIYDDWNRRYVSMGIGLSPEDNF